MALVVADRDKETSTTAGTGTLTLAGAVDGFQSFAVIGNGNTTYYSIVDSTANTWEVGIGTYSSSGTTLARTTVLANSSGNTSPISFASNSKDVFATYAAGKSVSIDASGYLLAGGESYQDFKSITAPTAAEGRVWYDTDQKSLAFYNDSSLSPVFIGENIVLKVYNNTGSTIAKGAAVYIQSGGSFTYPNVALARADAIGTAAVIGLMNASTPTGSFGYVTSTGVITGLNTGALTEGTILYLSPYSAGQLMNTVPPTGYVVQVGVVAHQNSTIGTIYTKQTTPLAISAATITGTLAVAAGGTGVTTSSGASSVVIRDSGASVSGSQLIASNGLVVNSNTVSASYSIPSGSSAMSVGPITVASGQSVTVPSGSKWVVL
jgi:hypothetical protein